jgi:hypothetical protein
MDFSFGRDDCSTPSSFFPSLDVNQSFQIHEIWNIFCVRTMAIGATDFDVVTAILIAEFGRE